MKTAYNKLIYNVNITYNNLETFNFLFGFITLPNSGTNAVHFNKLNVLLIDKKDIYLYNHIIHLLYHLLHYYLVHIHELNMNLMLLLIQLHYIFEIKDNIYYNKWICYILLLHKEIYLVYLKNMLMYILLLQLDN